MLNEGENLGGGQHLDVELVVVALGVEDGGGGGAGLGLCLITVKTKTAGRRGFRARGGGPPSS